MHLPLNRLTLFFVLVLFAVFPTRAGVVPNVTGTSIPPVFLTGTSVNDPNPYYQGSPFNTVPVGKTLVLPIVVSGSGPMTYSVTSSSPALAPIIKTGYPVMNIQVSYSGTNATPDTLYSFSGGSDGGNPYAGLVTGTDGNFYGTTVTDGTGGHGTVFRITASGSLTTLYSFTGGADGANPYAGLIQGTNGSFYGTTEGGGSGAGTVFQITASGSLATLYSFTGGTDGGNSYAGLVTGTDGNFYGTTSKGGSGTAGTVFRITTSGSLATLYPFTGGTDGGNPQAGLVTGTDGNLYGTTESGGSGTAGTVFQITTSGSLATLYSFTGGTDGKSPYARLIQGSTGALYGTTAGDGTVFRITTSGSLTTLYSFTGGADGANPYAGLVPGSDGNLYGTTETDGTSSHGTVYKITSSGSLSTLYSFAGGNDGGNPYAGLIQGSDGNFYGTTETNGANGHGTIFEISNVVAPPFSGTMTFALLRDLAPATTAYIAGFAQAGYYHNCNFFRITNLASSGTSYIAQGGDPTNTGTGSPGFAFDNEFHPSLIFTGEGQLAMANAGEDQSTFHGTNGSQFFITQNSIRSLDFGYTIFGQLLQGFDVMQKVMAVATGTDGSSPTAPVVMDSVTVSEDNTDAVLLVNAAGSAPSGATINVNATDPSKNKAVVYSGTTPTTGLSLNIVTFNDTVNDPPIIEPEPNVFGAIHQNVTLPIRALDLEFDDLSIGAEALSNATSATLTVNGNVATIKPNAYSPVGSLTAGLYVYQPLVSSLRSSQYDLTAVTAGLGSGKLTSLPGLFSSTPGTPLNSNTSTAFGAFLTSNPRSAAGNFTATINWGDGSPLASGTGAVSVVQSSGIPTEYSISCPSNHTYKNPGIYPLVATVTDTNGNFVKVENTAVISPGPIYPAGRLFTATKGSANCLVAAFVDHTPNTIPADYKAIINWGDGAVTTGSIRGSNPSFLVYGKHNYTGGSTYPVDVTINSTIGTNSGYAWSTARLTGVPTHQPPFAQSHINGEISGAGFGAGFVDEQVTLFNSGDLPSSPISIKFYLSPTSATQPISSGALPLRVGSAGTYNAVSIPAGSEISGVVSNIEIPSGVISRNKYIIMQVISSDPIGSHMDYPRAFADPNPLSQ